MKQLTTCQRVRSIGLSVVGALLTRRPFITTASRGIVIARVGEAGLPAYEAQRDAGADVPRHRLRRAVNAREASLRSLRWSSPSASSTLRSRCGAYSSSIPIFRKISARAALSQILKYEISRTVAFSWLAEPQQISAQIDKSGKLPQPSTPSTSPTYRTFYIVDR